MIWHIHYVLPLCNASTNIHCEKQVASSSVTFDAISYVVAYYAMACLICDDSASWTSVRGVTTRSIFIVCVFLNLIHTSAIGGRNCTCACINSCYEQLLLRKAVSLIRSSFSGCKKPPTNLSCEDKLLSLAWGACEYIPHSIQANHSLICTCMVIKEVTWLVCSPSLSSTIRVSSTMQIP